MLWGPADAWLYDTPAEEIGPDEERFTSTGRVLIS